MEGFFEGKIEERPMGDRLAWDGLERGFILYGGYGVLDMKFIVENNIWFGSYQNSWVKGGGRNSSK